MKLYRYLDLSGGLATLGNSALNATRPIHFNDPFEYLLRVKTGRRMFRKEFLARKEIQQTIEARITTKLATIPHKKQTKRLIRQINKEITNALRTEFEKTFESGRVESMNYRLETLSKSTAVTCFTIQNNHPLM